MQPHRKRRAAWSIAFAKCITSIKANVHRGVHTLSQEATDRVEEARTKVKEFINAGSTEEIIFTRGTTEGINLVASSFGDSLCNGDEIIITVMEHHSNIVPWQLLQRNCRVVLRVVPINADGSLMLDAYEDLFSDNHPLGGPYSCVECAWHRQSCKGK